MVYFNLCGQGELQSRGREWQFQNYYKKLIKKNKDKNGKLF